jgi:methylated-DNA-[protein]-cysteine S-methyltransferase
MAQLQRTVQTPHGAFTFFEEDGCIVQVKLGHTGNASQDASALLQAAEEQLLAYLGGRLQSFSLPFAAKGTPFQKQCWEALLSIPYGGTMTYGQLAKQIGRPGAVRAVGMAAHRNPLPILIPCHRLIGAGGRPTGYAGGIPLKETLLRLERNTARPSAGEPQNPSNNKRRSDLP